MKSFTKYNTRLQLKCKHIQAEIFKQLCLISNNIVINKLDSLEHVDFNGYEVVAKLYDRKTNFKSVAYKKDKQIVICFVGTDSKCFKDHCTNFVMGIGVVTRQMKKAKAFTEQILDKYQGFEIIVAGHSEGGSEAQYVGLSYGLPTYTYNPFAISKSIQTNAIRNNKGLNTEYLVNNYRDSQDPISKLFYKDVGNTYIVESTLSDFKAKTPFGSNAAHSLKNMGNCANAIPLYIYKKEHPFFINKIGKAGLIKFN